MNYVRPVFSRHRGVWAAALTALSMLAVLVFPNSANAVLEPGDPVTEVSADGDFKEISVSDDGRYVAFLGNYTVATSNPSYAVIDLYVHDRTTGVTTNVTPGADAPITYPEISGDGSTIVFVTRATNLTSETDTTGYADLFRYDIASGVTTRVTGPNSTNVWSPSVSGDGSQVAFGSQYPFAGPQDSAIKIFMHDASGFQLLVRGSSGPSTLSADGSVLGFGSYALGSPQGILYTREIASGVVTSLQAPVREGEIAGLSADGRFAVAVFETGPFRDMREVWIVDRQNPASPQWTKIAGTSQALAEVPAISADGSQVFYVWSDLTGYRAYRYDVAAEQRTRLRLDDLSYATRDLATNADGSLLAFSTGRATSSVTDIPWSLRVMAEPPRRTCVGQEVTVDIARGEVPTNGDDVIIGTGGNDVIDGLGGHDLICSGSGNDTVYGGNGNDIIYGGSGNDKIWGELGNDTVIAGPGNDTGHGGYGDDDLSGAAGRDVLTGGAGDDTIRGGAENDVIRGGADNDTLRGDGGRDELRGGAGNDKLYGGNSGDFLFGDAGQDVLRGVRGNDQLDGGTGYDTCNGGQGTDSAARCQATFGVP